MNVSQDYPGGAEFFDIYSPELSSLYSQVFWTGFEPVALPKEIVSRFDGKGMSIVGFELDQVRELEGGGEERVPINVAYNHHFESHMVGKKSKIEKLKVSGPDDPRLSHMMHGYPEPWKGEAWVVTDLAPENDIPTSQSFGGANGGEVRKSFHGYPPGMAQIIDSPTAFQITPMQIDTWNRDHMNISGGPFVPGPQPRNSLAPQGPDALYSGLLECPVTTRVRKDVAGDYSLKMEESCTAAIQGAEECFAAAAKMGAQNSTTDSGSNDKLPSGCSLTVDENGETSIYFNKAASTVQCGKSTEAAKKIWTGMASSLITISVSLDQTTSTATITMGGPNGKWFGAGFNATAMKDAPWAIIVDGTGKVTERQLADQSPGKELPSSVTVVKSTLEGETRTVVMTRPFKGEIFSFDPNQPELPFINAVGTGPQLAYHHAKTVSSLLLLRVDSPTCICAEDPLPFGSYKAGTLTYNPTNQTGDVGVGSVGFNNRCAPQPRVDLLAYKNPTCDVRTYVGGQLSCHHMWSLLDADQTIPWPDQPLKYRLKFRFWFQEYIPASSGGDQASHASIVRGAGFDIGAGPAGAGAEFDVPKCAEGVVGCSRAPDGTWIYTTHGLMKGGAGKLVAAHMHCHAPTCLSMSMTNNKTGEVICREVPIYGGTGKIDLKSYDEPGFIAVPPCLFGDAKSGPSSRPSSRPIRLAFVRFSWPSTSKPVGEILHEPVRRAAKLISSRSLPVLELLPR